MQRGTSGTSGTVIPRFRAPEGAPEARATNQAGSNLFAAPQGGPITISRDRAFLPLTRDPHPATISACHRHSNPAFLLR